MNTGLWTWPPDPKGQKRVIRTVSDSPHLTAALQAIVKSKDGMSNSELDELLADSSNWITIWLVKQLLALGFIEYRVDFFGGPARYAPTDLGGNALSAITGQPAPQAPPAVVAQPPARPTSAGTQPQPGAPSAAGSQAQPGKA
ncbi:MAG TPA: hypothetical protein VKF15_00855 [Nitrososphaerales archaeon]|nr:hypothetical protein [Nitrososphaerales archaeon]